jgi:integrase
MLIDGRKPATIELGRGWINFPRPKTGVTRRIPLWPETVAALRAIIADHPEPQTDELVDHVFLTSRGGEWIVVRENGGRTDKIAIRFPGLLTSIGAYELR